ncbi:hypothetical protein PHET_07307 [Paragonimus heterotremus]|uniref:Uncharacterized protein n=1 Tax=Paragonimus heterotremus TaxID=100268 RepID=A0A8J4T9R0_9TREM|nr:hypothetical protein PHET_07307 [Paragonimus heterotremus]
MSVENPSCAHPLLPNSISWSGQLHNCQQPPSNVPQLVSTHQSSRSWARSKRISLGCIEFRTTYSGRGRSPRPKSTCSKLETSNTGTSETHPSQPAAMNSQTGIVAVASAGSDVCHGNTLYKSSRSNKARSGADALLRRLRMRSSAKPRSQTPNECRSNNAMPAFTAVSRSSSAPRPCASSSNDENVLLNSVFIGRPLHMQLDTTERSTLSLKSAPELTDALSSFELSPMSTQNGRKSAGFAELMTQSFIPSRPVELNRCNPFCFENTFIKPSETFYNSRPALCTWEPSCDNTLHRPLYRPLSQPTCTCKSHSVHSMSSDWSYTLPTAHTFHYPRPTFSPSFCGHPSRADTRPQRENLPLVCYQHPQSFPLPQYGHPPSAYGRQNTTYWSRQDNLSRSPPLNTNLPSNTSQFIRPAVAVGQLNEANSTRSSDIGKNLCMCFSACWFQQI